MSGLPSLQHNYFYVNLKKIGGKKFERKKVRLFRRFELFSARTFFLIPQLQLQLQLQLKLSLALFSINPSDMWLHHTDMWLHHIDMWLHNTDMWLHHLPGKVLNKLFLEIVQQLGSSILIKILFLDSQDRAPMYIYCQAQLQLQLQLKLSLALFSINPSDMWLLHTDMWLLHLPGKVLNKLIKRLFNSQAVQYSSKYWFWTRRIEHQCIFIAKLSFNFNFNFN